MNRYLECGNLIVRTDSFDKLKELSEPLIKKKGKKRKRKREKNLGKNLGKNLIITKITFN